MRPAGASRAGRVFETSPTTPTFSSDLKRAGSLHETAPSDADRGDCVPNGQREREGSETRFRTAERDVLRRPANGFQKAGDRTRTGDIQLGKQPGNPTGDTEKSDSEHPPSTGPSSCAHAESSEADFVAVNWDRLPNSVRAAIISLVRASL
jgi:hypothetical protein